MQDTEDSLMPSEETFNKSGKIFEEKIEIKKENQDLNIKDKNNITDVPPLAPTRKNKKGKKLESFEQSSVEDESELQKETLPESVEKENLMKTDEKHAGQEVNIENIDIEVKVTPEVETITKIDSFGIKIKEEGTKIDSSDIDKQKKVDLETPKVDTKIEKKEEQKEKTKVDSINVAIVAPEVQVKKTVKIEEKIEIDTTLMEKQKIVDVSNKNIEKIEVVIDQNKEIKTDSANKGIKVESKNINEGKKEKVPDLSPFDFSIKETELKKEGIDTGAKTEAEPRKDSKGSEELNLYQVTTPTSTRRAQSQRISREERPNLVPVHFNQETYSSDEEEGNYIVEEPKDQEAERIRIHSSPDIFGFESYKKPEKIIVEDPEEVWEEKTNIIKEEIEKNREIIAEREILSEKEITKIDLQSPLATEIFSGVVGTDNKKENSVTVKDSGKVAENIDFIIGKEIGQEKVISKIEELPQLSEEVFLKTTENVVGRQVLTEIENIEKSKVDAQSVLTEGVSQISRTAENIEKTAEGIATLIKDEVKGKINIITVSEQVSKDDAQAKVLERVLPAAATTEISQISAGKPSTEIKPEGPEVDYSKYDIHQQITESRPEEITDPAVKPIAEKLLPSGTHIIEHSLTAEEAISDIVNEKIKEILELPAEIKLQNLADSHAETKADDARTDKDKYLKNLPKADSIFSTDNILSAVNRGTDLVETAILDKGTDEPQPDILNIEDIKSVSEKSKEILTSEIGNTPEISAETLQLISEQVPDDQTTIEKMFTNLPSTTDKPRALFHIESDEDMQLELTNLDVHQPEDSESSVEEFVEKIKRDIEDTLEKEEIGGIGIFNDLSEDSLLKTKEIVDERLRKISDIKVAVPEPEVEEVPIQIGRFQVAPAHPVVEKELSEKLTEADFEEVLRELKMEGLQPGVYLLPEELEKQEKKEKTLKRVERRFERMASETLESDVKAGNELVSEDTIKEKREEEFEKLVSQLSHDEVTESQQEYQAIWDEGGLSSLTPTDDWESRDPDTPNNELDEDPPKKTENFQGSQGHTKESLEPETQKTPLPISPKSPQVSGPQINEEDDTQSYVDRKKFWEQMSSSQSSDKKSFNESIESMHSEISESSVIMRTKRQLSEDKIEFRKSLDQGGLVKNLTETYSEKIAAGELIMPAIPRPISGPPRVDETEEEETRQDLKSQSSTDRAVLSELEAKILERMVSDQTLEESKVLDQIDHQRTEKIEFTIGDTTLSKEKQLGRGLSTDSEAEFLAKYGDDVVAFENNAFEDDDEIVVSEKKIVSEIEKWHTEVPGRKSIYERSMSLPPEQIGDSNLLKTKKRHFEAQMKKEIIVEQLMTQVDEEFSPPEHKAISDIIKITPKDEIVDLSPEEVFHMEVETIAKQTISELISESEDIADIRRKSCDRLDLDLTNTTATAISSSAEEALQFKRSESVSKTSDSLEVHVDKSETESSEKDKEVDEVLETLENESAIKTAGKILDSSSVGGSEDTQSESDITPEDARTVDNEVVTWEVAAIHSDGVTPKEDINLLLREGQRIGRWVGQENLANEPWEKSDESDEFKIETKWERTRSESASPKDPVVYTPEEHYPDTVWEVPVQEQMDTDEITLDIPIEKQTIIEKDEEEDDEELKEQITEEEARDIAEDIVNYIEEEVDKRASLMQSTRSDSTEEREKIMDETVSTYIRQLAGEKDLDEREVELIESVLARKQREEIMKIQRTNTTTTSSMEITDEDLRSSGMDTDASPGESQIEKDDKPGKVITVVKSSVLETIKSDEVSKTEEDVIEKTIAEVRESLEAAQEELIEQIIKEKGNYIKESSSEFEFTVKKGFEETTKMSTHVEEAEELVAKKESVVSQLKSAEKSSTFNKGSSEESQEEEIKSPSALDPLSSSSGGVQTTSKSDIVLRHSSSSSKSGRKEINRLSAIEPYSSSGESHYQSFEQTSSRPCSSDIEALLASGAGTTGSSEYESAISRSRVTTTGEYVTAKSSLSSRESIKSLDSESSGHLGSVEISSEASETLIASAMEFDRDDGAILLDDDSPDMIESSERPTYITQHSAPATANRDSVDDDFEPVSDCEPVSWTADVSEEEGTEVIPDANDSPGEIKMKRSQEMTFQPIPKPIIANESMDSLPGDASLEKYIYSSSADETMSMISLQDERLATSLEETGSVLSMSLSTASEASAVRTIIELSRTESDKIDTSLTISGGSVDSGSREELDSFIMPTVQPTSEVGTSTSSRSIDVKTSSVTMTTTSVDESGTFCVSTQVTSLSRKSSEADENSQSSTVPSSDETTTDTSAKRSSGHRRKESTSSFVPSMLWTVGETKSGKSKFDVDDVEERAESDQFTHEKVLTDKENKNDEKKESDDLESYQTEADQAMSQDYRTGRSFVPEHFNDDDFESKDDITEHSEAHASLIELELEDSVTYSKRDEYSPHISPVREEFSETQSQFDFIREKHDEERKEKLLTAGPAGVSPSSPSEIPGITVTQHLAPLVDRDFHYPDLELEEQEAKMEETTQTPGSISSRASSTTSTDQGKEYVVNDESDLEDRQTVSVSTVQTVREPFREDDELSSPNSDSFELLDKPDLSDEYVIIEEVGKEAEENDMEGKGVVIGAKQRKIVKKKPEEDLIESPPATETKMTDVKYFPGDEVGPFAIDVEGSSAASSANSEELDIAQYEKQLEESKRWIEMQFHGEQTGADYERAPLEDIKEEDLNEFESSSKIGSMGSMKESFGSIGSMKGSFGSTPDYDVLAGRKYFTRGDNDDASISSLQEFELLEKKILDGRKSGSSGSSQDSLNCRKLGTSNKSTGGDDFSVSSLKEFETIENICQTVVKIERRAQEEEKLLSEIEEGHESQVSESESCETMSAGVVEKESDSEDFDRKMFEIDEIIKQAKSNVEGFIETKAAEQTESVGRGDSFEEVSRIPDLELDNPISDKSGYKQGKITYSTQVVTKKQVQKWREESDYLQTSSGSPDHRSASDSLEVKQQKALSISTDSIELDLKRKGDIMTDSIEQGDTMSIDSFDLKADKRAPDTFSVDSFERVGRPLSEIVSDSLEALHRSDSLDLGEEEAGALPRPIDPSQRPPPRSDYILGSSDSLDPSSSTATHATYHYESDSVMSSSFTSGGSNTLVSDGEPQDLEGTSAWFENISTGGAPFVTEVVDRLDDDEYSHTIHRTVETAPDIRKVVFTGPNAEEALKSYVEGFEPGEDVTETEEIDEHGNVHIKRVVQRRIVVRPDEMDEKNMTPEQLKTYFKQFETETYSVSGTDLKKDISSDFSQTKAYTGKPSGEDSGTDEATTQDKPTMSHTTGQRRQLVTDISMDDDAVFDPNEHDWRHQVQLLNAEADDTEIDLQLDAALSGTVPPSKKS